MGSGTTRIGGLLGIASAATIIPAYAVGSPEMPRSPDDARQYYQQAPGFLAANGTLPVLHLLFGLLFLGVLVSVLRAAAGPTGAVYVALLGGATFVALTAAGLAAEVAVPQAIVRFQDVSVVESSQPFLALAVWLYHFSQVGSAGLIFATSYLVWRTGVFPRWSAVLGSLGVPALLHVWIGLPAAYTTIAWFALMGLVMLLLPPVVEVAAGESR